MASGSVGSVGRGLERAYASGTLAGLNEGQLLDRFVARGDGAAFEALVARHGPMVLGVCRRLLRDPNDVDDAFQATFLVLVRRAGSLRRSDLLGNWLYGVAYRVAARARSSASRRGAPTTGRIDEVATMGRDPSWDHDALLHAELARLPEKYRAPVVLCYLEGLTHEEAATQLGWPVGSVKGRLARARELLRSRLTRRGLTLTATIAVIERCSAPVSATAVRELPRSLVEQTVSVATRVAAGRVGAGLVSSSAEHLSRSVSHAMSFSHVKSFAAVVATMSALAGGAGVFGYQGSSGTAKNKESESPPAAAAKGGAAGSASAGAGQAPAGADASRKTESSPVAEKRAGGGGGGIGPAQAVENAGAPEAKAVQPGPPGKSAASAKNSGGLGPGMTGGLSAGMPGMMGGMGGFGGGGGMDREILQLPNPEDLDPDGFRSYIARLVPVVQRLDKSPQTKAIVSRLDEPVSMQFPNETPLQDVLQFIREAFRKDGIPLPIYLDPIGLTDAEKTATSTVTLDLEGVPLKTCLRLLLKQIDLAYCVKEGVLIISSPRGIYQELLESITGTQDDRHLDLRLPGLRGGAGGGMR